MTKTHQAVASLFTLPLVASCAAPCPAPQAPQASTDAASEESAPPTSAVSTTASKAPAPAESAAPDANSFKEGQQQITMPASEIQFGPCPPTIPFACEMAVLEGNPKAAGLFTLRFRTKTPWLLPPHSHPRAERVTVLSGAISVAFGTTPDKSQGRRFSVGDYYVNAPSAVHYVWTEEPVEIQITGMGPWEVQPHQE